MKVAYLTKYASMKNNHIQSGKTLLVAELSYVKVLDLLSIKKKDQCSG